VLAGCCRFSSEEWSWSRHLAFAAATRFVDLFHIHASHLDSTSVVTVLKLDQNYLVDCSNRLKAKY